jgi:two-component system, OmpR family, phosphate regulon sensor histidine kinase PhoR
MPKRPPPSGGQTAPTRRLASARTLPRSSTRDDALAQHMVEMSPDAIVVVDGHGRIVRVNQQTEELFGYARATLLGQPIELLIPQRFHLAHTVHRARYFNAPHLRPLGAPLTLWGRHQDGSEFPVEISLNPLTVEERLFVISTIRDITGRQAVERLKDEFIALTAHELRTPMAIISGYAQTLGRARPTDLDEPEAAWQDWQEEARRAIVEATAHLLQLTENLLEVAQAQSGELTLRQEPQDLVALVRRIARQSQATTDRHQFTLTSEHEHVVVLVDARRMEEVLTHLLTNAIKYSPAGGPVAVTVQVDGLAHLVEVRISDQGIGIPTDQQTQIFARFARGENAQRSGIPGIGLGLYLCRVLVERHGGRIAVESIEGHSTTFTVTLPMHGTAE